MTISVFDLFKVGIGPSSSHTVGPMRAAAMFAAALRDDALLDQVCGIHVELFGSLGATGHGHGSVKAIVLGLSGELPESVDPVAAGPMVAAVRESGRLRLLGAREIEFDPDEDIVLHRRKRLPFHPNGMRFEATGAGGLVRGEDEAGEPQIVADATPVPYPFSTGAELLAHTSRTGLPISGVMMANELVRRDADAISAGLLGIWTVMQECVERGCAAGGVLPGGLRVR